jgi:hypothetical protein
VFLTTLPIVVAAAHRAHARIAAPLSDGRDVLVCSVSCTPWSTRLRFLFVLDALFEPFEFLYGPGIEEGTGFIQCQGFLNFGNILCQRPKFGVGDRRRKFLVLSWKILSKILTITHLCSGLLPGNREDINVYLAEMVPDVDVVNDGLLTTTALVAEVAQTDTRNAVDTSAMRDLFGRVAYRPFDITTGTKRVDDR